MIYDLRLSLNRCQIFESRCNDTNTIQRRPVIVDNDLCIYTTRPLDVAYRDNSILPWKEQLGCREQWAARSNDTKRIVWSLFDAVVHMILLGHGAHVQDERRNDEQPIQWEQLGAALVQ